MLGSSGALRKRMVLATTTIALRLVVSLLPGKTPGGLTAVRETILRCQPQDVQHLLVGG